VKHKRNILSRSQKKNNHAQMRNNEFSGTYIPGCVTTTNKYQSNNDGLLHYAPYRVVIVPSKRFYETLCVAEQGRIGDPDHQHPVFHSVIPNQMAREYEDKNIFPSGCISDVVLADQYFFVPVEIPFEEGQPTVHFMIRRVLIRYSLDYKKAPKNGTCCLSNTDYFESCAKIFGPEWENNDIKNNVDACLISGEPGRNDKGRNEILLAGRIYRKGFEIPTAEKQSKDVRIQNSFLYSCYNSIKKKGFVTYRSGGSAGDNGATAEQLQFFKKNPGCFPTVAGATLHLYVGGGKWRGYYVSPYEVMDSCLVAVWPYSTPQMGGHFKYTRNHSDKFPEFFDRMSMCRSTIARIIMSLHDRQKLNISPRAAAVQEKYTLAALNKEYSRNIQQGSINCKKAVIDNLPDGDNVSDVSSCDSSSIDSSVAEIVSKKRDSVLGILNRQVIYSFVAYTVGNHQDVTKRICSRMNWSHVFLVYWILRQVTDN
jgi:hypothetical protein